MELFREINTLICPLTTDHRIACYVSQQTSDALSRQSRDDDDDASSSCLHAMLLAQFNYFLDFLLLFARVAAAAPRRAACHGDDGDASGRDEQENYRAGTERK